MESFFRTLKVERVHPACRSEAPKVGPVMPDLRRDAAADRSITRIYATRTEARRDLFAYIEGFCNSRRLHPAIGYRSPADMERMAA